MLKRLGVMGWRGELISGVDRESGANEMKQVGYVHCPYGVISR